MQKLGVRANLHILGRDILVLSQGLIVYVFFMCLQLGFLGLFGFFIGFFGFIGCSLQLLRGFLGFQWSLRGFLGICQVFLRCFLGIFHKFIECLVFSKGCSGTFWLFWGLLRCFFGGFEGASQGFLWISRDYFWWYWRFLGIFGF